jgi:4-hydroxy-2-oxoheptanedioate aldolase
MADYMQRADLWPLNPAGDLIAIMMIETAEGVKNVDAIAQVPGVGGFYIGPSDLSNSMGVASDSPETEAAIQTVLKACLTYKVACGISASAAVMPRRVKEGFRILGAGGLAGGLSPNADAALRAGRSVAK